MRLFSYIILDKANTIFQEKKQLNNSWHTKFQKHTRTIFHTSKEQMFRMVAFRVLSNLMRITVKISMRQVKVTCFFGGKDSCRNFHFVRPHRAGASRKLKS